MTTFDAARTMEAMLDLAHPRKTAAADWAREHAGTRSDGFDRDRWKQAAELGVLGLRTPTAFGGSDLSTVETLLTFEGLGLGSADAGFVFSLASQVFAMQTALIEAGSPAQKAHWLPLPVQRRCDRLVRHVRTRRGIGRRRHRNDRSPARRRAAAARRREGLGHPRLPSPTS